MSETSRPRKPGRPTRQQALLIRHEILDASWRLVTSQGYDATSMDAIAAAGRVSKKTLYAYYPTKAHLFAAAFEERVAAWEQAGTIPLDHPAPLASRVYSYAEMVVRMWYQPQLLAIMRIFLAEGLRFPELGRQFDEKAFALGRSRFQTLIRTADDAGDYDLSRLETAASVLLDILWGWISRELLADRPMSLDRHLAEVRERVAPIVIMLEASSSASAAEPDRARSRAA